MPLFRPDPTYAALQALSRRRKQRLWVPPGPSGPIAPNDFVTRDPVTGNLMLNGQRYRCAGANNGSTSWNMTENSTSSSAGYGSPVTSSCARPTNLQIEEQIRCAVEMNANVIRTFSFLMVSHPLALTSAIGVYNEDSFERIDYALALCRSAGIRVIAPLVDNYTFFMGGRNDWCTMSGVAASASNFYNNSTVVANFKNHITTVLNHVNRYTGVRYRDDPTILFWETGNELDVGSGATWTEDDWTEEIATHIKDFVGAQQLVMDGHTGMSVSQTGSLALAHVDAYTNHPYGDTNGPPYFMNIAEACHDAGKAYLIGEATWTGDSKSGSNEWELQDLLSQTLGSQYCDGFMYWELHPPLVNHGDGFALHWPGDTADMQARARQLADHAGLMRTPEYIAPISIQTNEGISVNSANASLTFSNNYLPKEDDYVILVRTSISVKSAGTLDPEWTNLLSAAGAGSVLVTDEHTVAVVARFVTAAEEAADTLTYTATGVFDSTTNGGVVGVVLRGVDKTNPLDSLSFLLNSDDPPSPHTLAGLEGDDLTTGGQIISVICKATTNAYTTPLGYGLLDVATANQGVYLYSKNAPAITGADIDQTPIVVNTAGDNFISVTMSFTPKAGAPNEGTAAGSYTWSGTATGKRTPKASASAAYTWSSTATGTRAPKGSHSGAYTWASSAAGKRVAKATASGAYAWSSAATGKRVAKATASGSYTWVSTATGKRVAGGVANGVYVWASDSAGDAPANRGSASGAYTWSSTATGDTPANRGSASGAYAWTATAAGKRTPKASVSGNYTWASTATGKRVPKAAASAAYTWSSAASGVRAPKGTVTGEYGWDSDASGARSSKATASSSYAWSSTAQGLTPEEGVSAGTAAGAYTFGGAATGLTTRRGTVNRAYTWSSAAAGRKAVSGAAATGNYTWGGVTTGEAPALLIPDGVADGDYGWGLTAVGVFHPLGVSEVEYQFKGTVLGEAVEPGPLTVYVEAENRTTVMGFSPRATRIADPVQALTVAAESRLTVIAAELGASQVAASPRSSVAPAESRMVTVPADDPATVTVAIP